MLGLLTSGTSNELMKHMEVALALGGRTEARDIEEVLETLEADDAVLVAVLDLAVAPEAG
jgi:hypothetical protein